MPTLTPCLVSQERVQFQTGARFEPLFSTGLKLDNFRPILAQPAQHGLSVI